jgi:hypothetical protein|uniref:Uncharacterized protein n=1 Tax=Zea mays TaxID=4577 RepID=C0HFA1_MAIZE|nr:unknown [Zea mays]
MASSLKSPLHTQSDSLLCARVTWQKKTEDTSAVQSNHLSTLECHIYYIPDRIFDLCIHQNHQVDPMAICIS